jgi:hypothetical protein
MPGGMKRLIRGIGHQWDHRKIAVSDGWMLRTEILERRAGIEPANTGFADLRVDRFATGA